MKWIDGSDIGSISGEELCGRISEEMYGYEEAQRLEWEEPYRTAALVIGFDTELTMEGIFAFLENSIGHYAPEMIKAFRIIGDDRDADILSEICSLAPPDAVRAESLGKGHDEYDVTCFNDDHELREDIADRISELEQKLYLNDDPYFDKMWQLLFEYADRCIK